ncbi:hypothetical protein DL766_008605 [Monosporascus sp. MC13-8B]|uniref:Uncharacterized protein n=1 Tax=Monosporascus cannonballus TaxID=155416 RepID=A0ABY0HCA5_9PEZI|nr:hypothetical protein DL763_007263 [Monosporascus cannonballus]RYO87146.1 hypothetical protein DL762_004350 [Monosporascus cannonballus]RYP18783.1 hypothetical protein DL766_008605 [Monosporascus sp. MC13-8B]
MREGHASSKPRRPDGNGSDQSKSSSIDTAFRGTYTGQGGFSQSGQSTPARVELKKEEHKNENKDKKEKGKQ